MTFTRVGGHLVRRSFLGGAASSPGRRPLTTEGSHARSIALAPECADARTTGRTVPCSRRAVADAGPPPPARGVHGALMAGYVTEQWTLKRVTHVIRRHFEMRYHHRYLERSLKAHGFMPQRPAVQAKERDDAVVRARLTHGWPALKKSSSPRADDCLRGRNGSHVSGPRSEHLGAAGPPSAVAPPEQSPGDLERDRGDPRRPPRGMTCPGPCQRPHHLSGAAALSACLPATLADHLGSRDGPYDARGPRRRRINRPESGRRSLVACGRTQAPAITRGCGTAGLSLNTD